MQTYLEKFHQQKSVFLKYRAGKKTALKAKAAIQESASAGRQQLSAAKVAGATKARKEVCVEEEATARKWRDWEDLDNGSWVIKERDAEGKPRPGYRIYIKN